MRPCSSARVAPLAVALLFSSTAAADASEIQYALRGSIRTIQQVRGGYIGSTPLEWSDHLGPPIHVGDPVEILLSFEPREPDRISFDSMHPGRSFASYPFQQGDYSLRLRIGMHEFGDRSTDSLGLWVEDIPADDSGESGHVIVVEDSIGGRVDLRRGPHDRPLDLGFHLGGGHGGGPLDDVRLPTSLAIEDFPNAWFALVPDILVYDGSDVEVLGSIDAIEVTVEGRPGVPPSPSTPVPEPGMMTLFGGLALAGLAWRRSRGRSAA